MGQIYAYKARNTHGVLVKGTVSADTQSVALKMLQDKDLFVIKLELSRDLVDSLKSKKGLKELFAKPIPAKDMSIFCRQFSVLYGAGVSIVDSLKTVTSQTTNKRLREAMQKVVNLVVSGKSIGESMKVHKDVFPAILYNMVAAGEASGALDTVLDRAAKHFEREFEIEKKVKSALFYPKIVVGAIVIVVSFLLVFVVPNFADLFSGMGVELPLPTRILIGMGDVVTTWWWLIVLGFMSFSALMTWFKGTPRGEVIFDNLELKMPIFGKLSRMNYVSRFCRNLATLNKSGVAIVPSLMLVRQTLGNKVIEEALLPAEEAIKSGQSIAVQLAKSGFFPQLVTQMVTVGEATGTLDTMLEKASDFYDDEIKVLADSMAQLIEPIVFIVLGVVVAFIILSIMLPMFDSLQLVS